MTKLEKFSDDIIKNLNIILTDINNRITFVSDNFSSLLGYSKDEFIGHNQSKFSDNTNDGCDDFLIQMSKTGKWSDTIKITKKNGGSIYFHVDAQKLINNDIHTGYFTIYTEITNDIENLKKIETICDSKNKFLANISHEIKTPLHAINGFLSLLKIRENDNEKNHYLDIILNNTQHLIDLTDDIIDLSSVSNGDLKIIPKEFSVSDIQSTIEVFFAKSLEKNIELTTYISPQLPELMLQDIIRLKQIYTNLISNAIKFVGYDGCISIEIYHHNEKLFFIISDNGIGMSPEQCNEVFKPFTQASMDTKLFYGGTGLGLSVVKEIIELMGGEIELKSAIGQGSIFKVMTPIKIVKDTVTCGNIDIEDVYLFKSSFSNSNLDIIIKYISQFSDTKIHIECDEKNITKIKNSFILINYDDYLKYKFVIKQEITNKLIIIKKMDQIACDLENENNTTTINLPLLGSNLYNAFNTLSGNKNTKNEFGIDIDIFGNILFADDLEANRLLIKELLSPYDIKLDIVADGKDAIKLFNKSIKNDRSDYDIVFVDINMLEVDGCKVAKYIRDLEKEFCIKRTPVIALTANKYYTKDDVLVNMDAYITKPINLKLLLNTINKYTKNSNTYISVDNYKKDNKVNILKNIRDDVINGNSVNNKIKNNKEYFTSYEFELLNKFIKINGDKRKFNEIYNKIMKNIRKSY